MVLRLFLLIFFSFNVFAKTVYVGGYYYPPYVIFDENEQVTGITIDIIKALNKIQKKYKFEFVNTSPSKRYMDILERYDIIFFENIDWGWSKEFVKSSLDILSEGERFICLKESCENKFSLKNLPNYSIAGILGYHYNFANNKTKKNYLRKNFNMTLSYTHDENVKLILNKKVDIAIVSENYLSYYLNNNKDGPEKIFVFDEVDKKFKLSALIGRYSTIPQDELNLLIEKLFQLSEFKKIFTKWGVFDKNSINFKKS